MKLSERLQLIADEINKGETMADIGTDHGFLPLYLLETGKCPHVVMADISSGSLKKAEDNCRALHPEREYDLRLGNGIDVLQDGEVDVVVIAGMGGLLIADILEWNLAKSRSIKRYILQPRNHVGRLRHWLADNGFLITKESLVREGKFICEILTVNSGFPQSKEAAPYSAAFDYPDSLLTFRNHLTKEYLERKLEIEEKIYKNISAHSKSVETETLSCRERINRLEHLLEKLYDENHGAEASL